MTDEVVTIGEEFICKIHKIPLEPTTHIVVYDPRTGEMRAIEVPPDMHIYMCPRCEAEGYYWVKTDEATERMSVDKILEMIERRERYFAPAPPVKIPAVIERPKLPKRRITYYSYTDEEIAETEEKVKFIDRKCPYCGRTYTVDLFAETRWRAKTTGTILSEPKFTMLCPRCKVSKYGWHIGGAYKLRIINHRDLGMIGIDPKIIIEKYISRY